MNNKTFPNGGTENDITEKTETYSLKAGRGVVAKLWKNSNKNGAWFNVTITHVYTDDEGEFHDSDSFSRDDLLQVAYAANKAFDFVVSQTDEDEDDE